MAETVRDKFLRQTRLGSWAVDVFVLNEERLIKRFRQTRISDDDRETAQRLFGKYREEARAAFLQGERGQQRLTDQHLRDARVALKQMQRHLKKDEIEASERLFALAKEHGTGKNAREILALLDNEKLANEVQEILGKVRFLEMPKSRKGDY